MKQASSYPDDAMANSDGRMDAIDTANLASLPALFNARIERSPDRVAYLQYQDGEWAEWTWRQFGEALSAWRKAFAAEDFFYGDRVAIRLGNCIEWVLFDQGAMGAGLVVVPVFAEDRADNVSYIVDRTSTRLLLVRNLEEWHSICNESETLSLVRRVVVFDVGDEVLPDDERLISLSEWLANAKDYQDPLEKTFRKQQEEGGSADDGLATIVFTSGTTGRPKGVMLSHRNILHNAWSGLRSIAIYPEDRMLSFLPLSHMFERTIGCYLNVIAGSSVAFNRSIPELLDDLAMVKPTVFISVPRIFERAYNRIKEQLEEGSFVKRWLFDHAVAIGWHRFEMEQGRADWRLSQIFHPLLDRLVGSKVRDRFGGNLRFVVSGGAPLSERISQVFIGLGLDILQGYGLTESSPVLTVNTLERNRPESIGLPLLETEIRLSDDGELQARGPGIMLGYFENEEATRDTMTDDGWLCSGDIASISDDGFISITGRIKEIIVLANGEKMPPADMEAAICDDGVFEQAMVVGEGKGYLSALVVMDPDAWKRACQQQGFSEDNLQDDKVREWALARIAKQVADFPGYANIHAVTLTLEPWTVDGGALTPTMKLKRPVLRERFDDEIAQMYEGH